MVTAIDFGVLRVLKNGNWDSIALTGGFAEVESNEVTVLVNKAEMGKNIDSVTAEAELEKAKNQLNKADDKNNVTAKIKAQETLNKAKAWLQASKSN